MNIGVHVVNLISCGHKTRANRPNRLISDDQPVKVSGLPVRWSGAKCGQTGCQLCCHIIVLFATFSMLSGLTNTKHNMQTGVYRRNKFFANELI